MQVGEFGLGIGPHLGIGFDADVVREVGPRLKRYLRSLAFPIVALKVFLRGGRPELHIRDGETTHAVQYAIIANSQYYVGWLMRLEGQVADNWEPELEASRQVYKLLAEQAEAAGDAPAAKKHTESLEADQ